MSILDRLEYIQRNEGLNKSEFERIIGKSGGYISALKKRESVPGSDVMLRIAENLPQYNIDWLITGNGSMNKDNLNNQASEPIASYESIADGAVILAMRDDIKNDLGELSKGVTKNFETLSHGVMRLLQDQQKILKFIDTIDAEKISAASAKLDEFLNKVNNKN